MRLRTSLSLLAFATAIPLIAFALLAADLVVKQENESLLNAAKARNRALMSAADGIVTDAIDTLQALSTTSELEKDDLRTFHALAQRVLATQATWNNLLLHDAEGRQLVNASLPWGTALLPKPVSPESIARAISTGRPTVEDLTVAPLLHNRLSLPVRVPVIRDGKVAYVLTAALDPAAFQRLLGAQDVPFGWVSGLVDGRGRYIARTPFKNPGSMAGKEYIDHVRSGPREGWYHGTTLDGYDTYSAYFRSDLTGWSIGYALPTTLITGGSQRAAWLMIFGAISSLAAALGIGVWLVRRIANPMSELAAAAETMGEFPASLRVASTIDEVSKLSTALNRASIGLAERDRELRQSREELREQAAELLRENANKSRFLALLSHELRNPLAPLRIGLAVLARQSDRKRAEDTRAMMERQVAHLVRLIDDLLDMSRIDRGVLELRRERVSVDSVVANAVEMVKPEIEKKQQQVTVCGDEASALFVDGDPVRLCQILSNLLSNACKFTPIGGHVELMVRAEGDDVLIAVSDEGIGFEAKDSSRIFEMFVQLEESKTQSTTGLGVGLPIARSLVEMHGGRLTAESPGLGHGATFTVRLPTAPAPKGVALRIVAESSEHGKGRVLVVDDNLDAADSLGELLRLNDFEVRVSYDAAEALEVAASFRPDVAFIDLNMPKMGGIDLAKSLQSETWAQRLVLIALTGMGQQKDLDLTRTAGFRAHLVKPAKLDDIVRLASGDTPNNIVPIRAEQKGDESRAS